MPHLKFVIGGALIIGAISYLMFSGINDSMVYYYGVSEVLAKAPNLYEKGIRVSGYVARGSIRRDAADSRVEFQVEEKGTGQTIPVVYQGIIPDTFKDDAEVVVEGKYRSRDQTFHATTLLAKCPSKYQKLEAESEGQENSGQ
ncbi:MAG: cytochrome c maturation protein CcmE [Acidobacteriota bacterium]